MSAGNRKNTFRPTSTKEINMNKNTKRNSIIALVVLIVVGIIIGWGASRAAAADIDSVYGPKPTTYTVEGVTGNKKDGFYVRYYNGNVKLLPPLRWAMANEEGDAAAERFVQKRYNQLVTLKRTLNRFGANNVFD